MTGDQNENAGQFVVFYLDEQRYALHLSSVERIVRVVEITHLPKAPEIILGVINLRSRIIPVINIRRRFSLNEREIDLYDHLVVARTPKRSIAFIADGSEGVFDIPEREIEAANDIFPDLDYITGIAKKEEGIIHILDLEKILSPTEIKSLEIAMEEEMEEDQYDRSDE